MWHVASAYAGARLHPFSYLALAAFTYRLALRCHFAANRISYAVEAVAALLPSTEPLRIRAETKRETTCRD